MKSEEALEPEVMSPLPMATSAGEIVGSGQALQTINTGFMTAVSVQKPRERLKVIKACEEEAAIAGDEFYYGWTVKAQGGSKLVEGPGIGLAQSAARNWGNCAVMMDVKETQDTYIFTPTFVDLETGFNLQRAFRQVKNKDIGKKYDRDRAEDLIFQLGQSKAIRNVICNALPNWLINKMMVEAKKNIVGQIEKAGKDVARQKVLDFFARYNITQDRVEAKLGKKAEAWKVEDIALLYGAMKTLADGAESPDELFPPTKPAEATFNVPPELKEQIDTLCGELGVSEADKAMRLGSCRGDIAKIELYRNELMIRVGEKEKAGKQEPAADDKAKGGLFEEKK
jgi:hypothetical protein